MPGKPGTKRTDLKRTCPVCGQRMKPSNLERHVKARHPEHVPRFRHERLGEMLRWPHL